MSTYYDPNEVRKPSVLIGRFPAHLIQFEPGTEHTHEQNGTGIPYNTKVIFDDCSGLTGKNGKDQEFPADHMKGVECIGKTIWFNINPPEGKSWLNRWYKEWCDACGYNFPEETIEVDGEPKVVFKLVAVEEKDVYGSPVFANVELIESRREKGRFYPTVVSIEPREGERLDYEEKLLAELEASEGKKESAGF